MAAVPRVSVEREAGGADRSPRPIVSVIMASYEAAGHIEAALRSILAQSLRDLEVIVCDDASPDRTVALVTGAMRADPRVRLIALGDNGGPSRARNRALDEARGEWVAIVDADDLLHPERLERMVAAAGHFGADVVADDLLLFDVDRGTAGNLLEDAFPRATPLTPAALVGERGGPALGYLKPLIRRRVVDGLRYDEGLRVGEDFDFLFRLILGGAKGWLVPEPWYLYRRHAASTSHRLSDATLDGLIAMAERFLDNRETLPANVPPLLAARLAGLYRHRDFAQLADALVNRRFGAALSIAARRPATIGQLLGWLAARAMRAPARLLERPPLAARPARRLVVSAGGGDAPDLAVPAYRAPDAVDWTAAASVRTWLRIAELGLDPAAELVGEGAAGAYALGFNPARDRMRGETAALTRSATAEPAIA